MKFPSAHKGVRTIFIGVLLEVLAAIIGIVNSFLATLPEYAVRNSAIYNISGVLAIVAGVMVVIAFILEIVGLFQAKADDKSFAYALWVILFVIIATIVRICFSFINQPWVKDTCVVIDAVAGVSGLVVVLYIVTGISNLSFKLKEESFAASGRVLRIIIAILFLVSLALSLVANFVRMNQDVIKIMGYVAIGAAVVEFIAYVWYFIYLACAPKKLSK